MDKDFLGFLMQHMDAALELVNSDKFGDAQKVSMLSHITLACQQLIKERLSNQKENKMSLDLHDAIKKELAVISPEKCPDGWSAGMVKINNEIVYIYTHPDCPEIKNEITPEV